MNKLTPFMIFVSLVLLAMIIYMLVWQGQTEVIMYPMSGEII